MNSDVVLPSARQTLCLSGEDWELSCDPQWSSDQSIAASVPGDVHADLERAGRLADIHYGLNSREGRDVPAKPWWYRKRFVVPESWRGKTMRLRFDGVDYACRVRLNDVELGRHEGQFTTFEFDVTRIAKPGDENVLVIQIEPASPEVLEKLFSQTGYGWPHYHAFEAMVRQLPYWKCRTATGWDWGTPVFTLGIWQDVNLVATNGATISQITIKPELTAPYDRAMLHLTADVRTTKPRTVELICSAECITADGPVSRSSVKVECGEDNTVVRHSLRVSAPALWWPCGYGEHNLYRLTVTAKDADTGEPLDSAQTTFGIRDLQILENPGAEDFRRYSDYTTGKRELKDASSVSSPQRYLISINGRKVFAQGGNWVPCDLLYGRAHDSDYERLIRLAAEANFTLLRLWGGGLIEKPVFYDLCDRYGLMVFQDFPNAGCRPQETDAALACAADEMRSVLPRLINHPCIVRYTFGNELYVTTGNSRQMVQFVELCRQLDPTRPCYGPDPVCEGQRHGPHWYDRESHYQVCNTGEPLSVGPDNPIEWTEYGAAGASSVETLRRIIPSDRLWPIRSDDEVWRWHKAFDALGEEHWLGRGQYVALFGEPPDLKTEVRCSQFVQAEALRYANQAMRRAIWHRSACAIWSYNEPWPNAAHGCFVEYGGRPKMAYYYVRRSFAPIDLSARYDQIIWPVGSTLDLELWVSSLVSESLSDARWSCSFCTLDGRPLETQSDVVSVKPDAAQRIGCGRLSLSSELAGQVVLCFLKLCDRDGRVRSRHLYTFGITSREQESPPLASMLHPPAAELRMERVDVAAVRVVNVGGVPALFVAIEAAAGETGLSPDENCFSLLPGEAQIVRFRTMEANAPFPARYTVTGQAWNSSAVSSVGG